MPYVSVRYLVPGEPGLVFEHVTGYPAVGGPDTGSMESKYGKLLQRTGSAFTFLENLGGGIKWECSFDPPRSRAMRAVESGWSDRYDWFEPSGDGTLWTVTWQLKARGVSSIIQRITFVLMTKRRFSSHVAAPVIAHFTAESNRA